MTDKKYPVRYFFIFVLTNFFFRFGILFLLGVVLCFIGIWVRALLWVGLGFFALDLVLSVIEQLAIRKAVLESSHPAIEKMLDEMNQPGVLGWQGKRTDMIEVEAEPADEET